MLVKNASECVSPGVNPYEPPNAQNGDLPVPVTAEPRMSPAAVIGLILVFGLPLALAAFAILQILLELPDDQLRPWYWIFWVTAGVEPVSLGLCIYANSKNRTRIVTLGIALATIGSIYFGLALLACLMKRTAL
jgi:hypothetical protein